MTSGVMTQNLVVFIYMLIGLEILRELDVFKLGNEGKHSPRIVNFLWYSTTILKYTANEVSRMPKLALVAQSPKLNNTVTAI